MKTILIFKDRATLLKKEIETDHIFKINDQIKVSEKDVENLYHKQLKKLTKKDYPLPRFMILGDGKKHKIEDVPLEKIEAFAETYSQRLYKCRYINNIEYDYENDCQNVTVSINPIQQRHIENVEAIKASR